MKTDPLEREKRIVDTFACDKHENLRGSELVFIKGELLQTRTSSSFSASLNSRSPRGLQNAAVEAASVPHDRQAALSSVAGTDEGPDGVSQNLKQRQNRQNWKFQLSKPAAAGRRSTWLRTTLDRNRKIFKEG